jgi:transposase
MSSLAAKLRLANAIEAVTKGESIRQAAIEENVNQSTLQRRILGVQSRKKIQ